MKLKKYFLLTLALTSFATFANDERRQKIKAFDKQIEQLRQDSKDLREQSELKKREANKVIFQKWLIERSDKVEKMFNGFEVAKSKKPRKVLIYSRTTGFRSRLRVESDCSLGGSAEALQYG